MQAASGQDLPEEFFEVQDYAIVPVAKEEWEYLINPITMRLLGAMGCLGISLYSVSLTPGIYSELFALTARILSHSPALLLLPGLFVAPLLG